MIKYITTYVLVLSFVSSSAQRQISLMVMTDISKLPYACMDLSSFDSIGTTQMVVSYALSYIQDVNSGFKRKDNLILQVGTDVIKCYGQRRYLNNHVYTTLLHGKDKNMNTPDWVAAGDGTIAYEIFFDRSRHTLRFFNEMPGWYSKRIEYEEEIPAIDWQIKGQCDSILGYKCYSAEGRFGGRDWHVAFTSELPVDAGPWKLCGLPGLILQAEDKERQFHFECLEVKSVNTPIYMYNVPTDKTTKSKWLRMERAMYQSPYFYFSNGGTASLSSVNGELDASWTIPYNPIELE